MSSTKADQPQGDLPTGSPQPAEHVRDRRRRLHPVRGVRRGLPRRRDRSRGQGRESGSGGRRGGAGSWHRPVCARGPGGDERLPGLEGRGDGAPVRAAAELLRLLRGGDPASLGRRPGEAHRLAAVRGVEGPSARPGLLLVDLLHVRPQAGRHGSQEGRPGCGDDDLLHGHAHLREGLLPLPRVRGGRARRPSGPLPRAGRRSDGGWHAVHPLLRSEDR